MFEHISCEDPNRSLLPKSKHRRAFYHFCLDEFNVVELLLLFFFPPLCLSLLLLVLVVVRILSDSIKRHPDILVRIKKQKMIAFSIMSIVKKTFTVKLIQVLNIFNISSLLSIHYLLYVIVFNHLISQQRRCLKRKKPSLKKPW